MVYGYNGTILRVNLSTCAIAREHPGENFYRRYIGGRGFAYYYLLSELEASVDPLGPDNKLIFATGVMTGAPIGGASRNSVVAKSPLTGGVGSSEAGGHFGQELKRAGYDVLIIEGVASSPCYLWICDGEVEIKDASHLWGKETATSQREIRQELDDPLLRTAQIGPAGENLVRYACIINDLNHAAGRGGLGAVMGSKKLKAVVARGHHRPPLADMLAVRLNARWFIDNPQPKMLHEKGTAGLVLLNNASGQLPTRNFQEGVFEGAKKISGERMQKSIVQKMDGCYACPLACMPKAKVKGSYSVNPVYGGPQYEALAMLGSNCGIDNLEALAKANELCNANTLDVISAGATVSYAMECFEKGILTKNDTGGLTLKFGNADAMLQLLKMIVERRGIGDLLAEGTKRASDHIGHDSEGWALQVKGQEVAAGEPRVDFGIGLGYAVSCTGADHGRGFAGLWYASPGPSFEKFKALGILEPIPLNDLSSARLRACKYLSSWRSFLDSSHMCAHLGYVYSFNQLAEMVNAVTGWNSSVFELLNVGERAETMARTFNARESIKREQDVLPDRFFEPLPTGPAKGSKMDRSQLNEAVLSWYKIMGWEPTTGRPLPEKLDELDISWAKKLR